MPRSRITAARHTATAMALVVLVLAGCTAPGARPGAGTDVNALRAAAAGAYDQQQWQQAEQYYRRLTEIAPDDAGYWYRLGNACVRLGRHGDAIAAYGDALKRDPAHAGAWYNLGMTQLRMATVTFVELREHVDPSDPAAVSAGHIVDAVTGLLEPDSTPAPDRRPQQRVHE